VSWLAASAYDSDGGHKMVSPLFDDVEWSVVSCTVFYNASCHSLHVLYLLLARWDAVFAVWGRWGDGRDGLAYCP